jgi:disulfide oxidoreductase YuzD
MKDQQRRKTNMLHKSWNVRDETKEALEELLKRKYKEIDGNFKMLKKISDINDAKKLLDEIWQMKSFANAIEMELIRREYNNEPAS